MTELEAILHNIEGTYKDFERFVLYVAGNNESNLEKLKDYILNTPGVTDEEVIDFINKNCEVIYNDDEIPEWAQDDEE
ncbi:MAG: hypothetical protein IJS61_01260 [Firmicutes bacterium]|nr:hypothetical protein [Bacillota bacterium]